MEIRKVCFAGPEASGSSIEQGCQKAGIEFRRVDIERGMGDLKDADLFIDAFSGDSSTKRKVIEKAEGAVSAKTLLASNPIFQSLTQLASFSKRPDKVIGLVFPFLPGKDNFAEMVIGHETSGETLQSLKTFLEKIGIQTIQSKDSAGFVLNRVLASMINEAAYVFMYRLANLEGIDQMMKLGANWPLGPFEFADEIGLDQVLNILRALEKELGPKYRPCPLLVRKVEAGHLGKKTGRGFHDYQQQNPKA